MIEMVYRDLAEFGLLFITPEAPAYAVRVREIQIAPWPFGPAIDTPPERAAVLEDGLCVGPDGVGLRESLTEQMQTQSDMAKEITKALRGGAGRGRIFEMLLPLARHTRPAPPLAPGVSNVPSMVGRSHGGHPHLLSMFASSSVQQLINADDARLLAWFDEAAAISPLRLHPPEQ